MLKVEIKDKKIIEKLENAALRHDKPYMRVKAGALLKIYRGTSALKVAQSGLHRRYDPDTVRGWVHTFNKGCFEDLLVGSGRGRKPAFFPSIRNGSVD